MGLWDVRYEEYGGYGILWIWVMGCVGCQILGMWDMFCGISDMIYEGYEEMEYGGYGR